MANEPSTGYRIDERVYFTAGAIAMVFFLILFYGVKKARTCEPADIISTDAELFAGSIISLKAETKNAETCTWDFGDSSAITVSSGSVTHMYRSAGVYHVCVTVNGSCPNSKTLVVSDRPLDILPENEIKAGFICKQTVNVNEQLTLTDTTHGAGSRQWFFNQREPADDTGRRVFVRFDTKGEKRISLRMNGREDLAVSKVITVTDPFEKQYKPDPMRQRRQKIVLPFRLPLGPVTGPDTTQRMVAPVLPPPSVKTAPDIQAEDMENLLLDVVKGKKTAAWFSGYFCDKPDVPVTYDNREMSFGEMCNRLREIKSTKKIDRLIVSLEKNKATRCILSIRVVVERSSFFKRVKEIF